MNKSQKWLLQNPRNIKDDLLEELISSGWKNPVFLRTVGIFSTCLFIGFNLNLLFTADKANQSNLIFNLVLAIVSGIVFWSYLWSSLKNEHSRRFARNED